LEEGKSYPHLTVGFYGSLSLISENTTWLEVSPESPPDNNGKGLTWLLTANGSWQLSVVSSSPDLEGRLWSEANGTYYEGDFTYTSSGDPGPDYQTTPSNFSNLGTNVASYTAPVTNWLIDVIYALGLPSWSTPVGTYTATHIYTLAPL